MSSLTRDALQPRRVPLTPEQTRKHRRQAERILARASAADRNNSADTSRTPE